MFLCSCGLDGSLPDKGFTLWTDRYPLSLVLSGERDRTDSPDMHSLRRETGRETCLLWESEEGEVALDAETDGVGVLASVRGLLVGFVVRPFSATNCAERL